MRKQGRRLKSSIKKWATGDEHVDAREEAGLVVIEPLREKTYKLDDLLKRINSKNVHRALDFGAPRGKEIW